MLSSSVYGMFFGGGHCELFEHLQTLDDYQLLAVLEFVDSRHDTYKKEYAEALLRQNMYKKNKLWSNMAIFISS